MSGTAGEREHWARIGADYGRELAAQDFRAEPDAGAAEALACVLDRHVTDAAFESGCRLSCGYDGDDLPRHMAEAILASDWLDAVRRKAEQKALTEAAFDIAHTKGGVILGRYDAMRWLLARAARMGGDS